MYKQLHDGYIRVLCLEPGIFGSTLRGSLEHYDFGHMLDGGLFCDYDAISYAWGPAIISHVLVTSDGNGDIPLTQTLYDALQHFRLQNGVRRLWADAVCINQADPIEKSAQVAITATIYGSARSVLIFLGPADEDDGLAFAIMSLYDELCRTRKRRFHFDRSRILEGVGCLERTLTLFHAARQICRNELQLTDDCDGRQSDPDMCNGLSNETSYGLWQKPCRLSVRRCSDLRDRIFAVRSVLALQRFDDSKPDYTLSHQDLYTKVAWLSLDTTNFSESELDPQPWMCFALVGTESIVAPFSRGPSWVPCIDLLSKRSHRKIFWYRGVSDERDTRGQFLAEPIRFKYRKVESDPRHIEVQGRCYATITEVYPDSSWPVISNLAQRDVETMRWSLQEIGHAVVEWYRRCYAHVAAVIGSETAAQSEEIERLIFGADPDIEDDEPEQALEKDEHSRSLEAEIRLCWAQVAGVASLSPSHLEHVVEAVHDSYLEHTGSDSVCNDRQRLLAHMTGDGVQDVGWVPETALLGDQMYVISGAPYPFVVRNDGSGGYTLLGDAHTPAVTLKQALGCPDSEPGDRYNGHYYMNWNAAETNARVWDKVWGEPDAEMLALIEGLGWLKFT